MQWEEEASEKEFIEHFGMGREEWKKQELAIYETWLQEQYRNVSSSEKALNETALVDGGAAKLSVSPKNTTAQKALPVR